MIGRKRVYGAKDVHLGRVDDVNPEATAAKAIKAFNPTSFTDQWKSFKVESKIDKAQAKYKKFLLRSVLTRWFALTPGYRQKKELRQEFLTLLVFKVWKEAASQRKRYTDHLAHRGLAQARRRSAFRARNECFRAWASYCFRTLYAKQKLHNASQWKWFASQTVKGKTSSASAEGTQAFDLCTPPVLKANSESASVGKMKETTTKNTDTNKAHQQEKERELLLEAAQTKCQDVESKYGALQEKLRTMIERLEMEKRELFEQSESQRASSRELSNQLKGLKSEKLEFSGKLKIAFLHIEGCKQHIKCLEGEKQKMEERLNTLRESEPTTNNSSSSSNGSSVGGDSRSQGEGAGAATTGSNHNQSHQMKALKEVNTDLAGKLRESQDQGSDLRVKVQALEKELAEKVDVIGALQSEVTEMLSTLDQMKVYNEGLEAKHLESKGKNNLLKIELQTALNTLQLSNLELEEMRTKASETNTLVKEKMHLEYEQEGLRDQVLGLSESVATLEHRLEASSASEGNAERSVRNVLQEISRHGTTKFAATVDHNEGEGMSSVRAMCDRVLHQYKGLAEENAMALKQRREDSKYLFLVLIIALFIPFRFW